MRTLLLAAAALCVLTTPNAARAEVQVRIRMGLPVVLPPLVEVRPGLQVVQDYDEEIFFADGYYWMQRDGRWYHARDYRQRWTFVPPGRESRLLSGHQPGQYRRFQHDERRVWPQPDRGHAERHWGEGEHRGGTREWRQPVRNGSDRGSPGRSNGNNGNNGNGKGRGSGRGSHGR